MKDFKQQLQEWKKKYMVEKKKIMKSEKKRKEKFTEKDLKELMGITRPIYRRGSGGAFRQR